MSSSKSSGSKRRRTDIVLSLSPTALTLESPSDNMNSLDSRGFSTIQAPDSNKASLLSPLSYNHLAKNELELMNLDIDEYINRNIEEVRSGNHADLLKHALCLEGMKSRLLIQADKHRKQQIKNINQLYEYEVEDIQTQYNKSFSEAQERLLIELQLEKNKLRQVQQQAYLKNNSSSLVSDGTLRQTPTASASSSATASQRLTRSSNAPMEASISVSHEKLPHEKLGLKRKVSSALLEDNPLFGFNKLIPESSIEEDFVEIVRAINEESQRLESSKPRSLEDEVVVEEDSSGFCIGKERFCMGEMITVHSSLSQELLYGMITSISKDSIVVRMGTGQKFSFFICQLQTGRVRITRGEVDDSTGFLA